MNSPTAMSAERTLQFAASSQLLKKGRKRRKRETTMSTWGSAGSSPGVTGSPDRRLAEEPSLPLGQLLLSPGRSFWTTVCPCERERAAKTQGWICWELGSSYTCHCWDRIKYNHTDFGLTQQIFCWQSVLLLPVIFLTIFFIFYTEQWIFIALSPKLHTLPYSLRKFFFQRPWCHWWLGPDCSGHCVQTLVCQVKKNNGKISLRLPTGLTVVQGACLGSQLNPQRSKRAWNIWCESTAPHRGQAQKTQHIWKLGEVSLMPFIHVGKADILQMSRRRSCLHCVSNPTKIHHLCLVARNDSVSALVHPCAHHPGVSFAVAATQPVLGQGIPAQNTAQQTLEANT